MDNPAKKTPLEGLFSGISSLLQMANDIVVRAGDDGAPVEVRRGGSTGVPGALNAVYGVSVRVGPRVAPERRPIRTFRRNASREPIIDDVRDPIADLFDEGDHYLVVAELPGVEEAAVRWSVRDGSRVVVSGESGDRKYHKEIELADRVDEAKAVACFANGVLELRLWKQFTR